MNTTLLYVSHICREAVAFVFVLSVLGKIRSRAAFARFRRAARLLSGLPEKWSDVVAWLVVVAEMAVVAGSVTASTAAWAFAGAMALLCAFTWGLSRSPASAMASGCGCFGPVASTRRTAIMRNVVLLVVAVAGIGSTAAVRFEAANWAAVLVCTVAAAALAAFLVRLEDFVSLFTTPL
ncbi:MauE/DoxX family redox-associated membrane protein [Micromonospora inaquosa]|uniref:Methylamine utilisation protein MauE domain-containing protein n=1 Tax=Micromonospora inaquosa TaxID=2203716 RepID=A0A3N9WZT2_9ACTN|nr:MauE/DoxX family redox-associated membrane protein [Micromonospora inaquosa]RQX06385.1 hypothetical protein DLJ59_05090 [Micromonospora inaquosa]